MSEEYGTIPAETRELFVEDGTDVWVEVGGINTAGRTDEAATQETSRFGKSHRRKDKFGGSVAFSYSGFAEYDEDGVQDAGQAKCVEHSRSPYNRANTGHFRIATPVVGEYLEFYANVLVTEFSGTWGNADTWKVDLSCRDWPVIVDWDGS